tara:strand:- start:2653 stop:4065 length:1413 start_codon:yes stop_codon:yes gene_type:complete
MKITKYIVMLVVIVLFTACENDLDTAPEDRFTTGSFYKNASDIEAAVNAAYGGLQKNGLYAFNYHILMETRSDNTFEEEPSNSGGFGDVDLFNRVTTNGVFRQTWVDSYVTIQATNIVLNRIEDISNMDNSLKNTRNGEMKFIRALVYYNLVNLYGGVPLVLQETSNPTDYFGQGRASVQEIFDQIILDLTEASSSLPESNDIGRANKGAALLLLGKAHLTQGNATDAETALRAINGYTFVNTYADLFGISNENNAASIFEVQFQSGVNGGEEGSTFASKFTSQKNPGSKGNNIITQDLLNSFEAGDLRRNEIIQDPLDPTVYISTKYVDNSRTLVDDGDNNAIVFRYADVLLSLAEALNLKGYVADGEAFDLINRIRTRAGLPNLTSAIITNQQEFTEALLKERRHEFFYENHRWFDLKRLGDPVQVMNNHFAGFVGLNITIDQNDLLLPIPLDQLNSDPGSMEQNPGY